MRETKEATGPMKCANCGAETTVNDVFCGNCGARLPQYVRAPDLRPKRRTGLLLVAALLAGLMVGGMIFWRVYQARTVPQQTASGQTVTQPAHDTPAQSETAPAPVEAQPQPQTATTAEKTEQPARRRKQQEEKSAASQNDTKTKVPQLLPQGTEQGSAPLAAPTAPSPAALASASDTPAKPPGRTTVQESESESAPMPAVVAPPANAPLLQPPASTPAAPVTPPPSAPAKPAYTGPRSGVAFWSGKLEKGQTLTINGNTASTGVLSGAPLPGVPVHITVDQTNLGFGEMPSTANAFRTLVLKSHSKHDKLTIRWEVAQ